MKYTTYEEPFEGQSFTEEEMKNIYKESVDKIEYPTYECWLFDILHSGVFEQEK